MITDLCHICANPIGGPRSGGHCMSCHKSFATDRAFDKHRTGHFGVDRRCMTTEEMLSLKVPMRLLGNGRWSTGASKPGAFDKFKKASQST